MEFSHLGPVNDVRLVAFRVDPVDHIVRLQVLDGAPLNLGRLAGIFDQEAGRGQAVRRGAAL